VDDISVFSLSLCERTWKLKEARRELCGRGSRRRFSQYKAVVDERRHIVNSRESWKGENMLRCASSIASAIH